MSVAGGAALGPRTVCIAINLVSKAIYMRNAPHRQPLPQYAGIPLTIIGNLQHHRYYSTKSIIGRILAERVFSILQNSFSDKQDKGLHRSIIDATVQ